MTLIEKLKGHVDMFSDEIPKKAKEKDYLKVGGVVTHVFNPTLLQEQFEQELGIYVTIDDAVGTINLMFARAAYDFYMEEIAKTGVTDLMNQTILVKGYYLEYDKSKTFKTKNGEDVTLGHPNAESPKILVDEIAIL